MVHLSPAQTELLNLLYYKGPVLASDLRKRFSRKLMVIIEALRRKGYDVVENQEKYPAVTFDIN